MCLKIGEPLLLDAVVGDDPGHEHRDHKRRDRIGGDNECSMRPETHDRELVALSACINCKVRNRRRKISVRIAASSRVT